jgi:hypothetical protein
VREKERERQFFFFFHFFIFIFPLSLNFFFFHFHLSTFSLFLTPLSLSVSTIDAASAAADDADDDDDDTTTTNQQTPLFRYHDHHTPLSYVDGLRGVTVVADPWSAAAPAVMRSNVEPAVVFVADHFHREARALAKLYVNASNSEGVEPVPASLWINGWAGVETPWCRVGGVGGGKGGGADARPPCKSAVVNAAEPIASCDGAQPNTFIVLVSGSAFAYFQVYLESKAELRARVLTVDATILADPVVSFLRNSFSVCFSNAAVMSFFFLTFFSPSLSHFFSLSSPAPSKKQ